MFVRARAHLRTLMTQKSCTVEMRNAKLGNHLKSLARFSTQLRVKESFKTLLAKLLRSFGDKSHNSLSTEATLHFSGPCRRVQPLN